jgi:hypothetical protein
VKCSFRGVKTSLANLASTLEIWHPSFLRPHNHVRTDLGFTPRQSLTDILHRLDGGCDCQHKQIFLVLASFNFPVSREIERRSRKHVQIEVAPSFITPKYISEKSRFFCLFSCYFFFFCYRNLPARRKSRREIVAQTKTNSVSRFTSCTTFLRGLYQNREICVSLPHYDPPLNGK